MVKLIESSQFADVPEIGVKLAEFNSPAMAKEAENIFGQSYDSLKPTDDRFVGIHLTALGDEETYGPNRNFDSFPKEACIKYHDTFVKHGHVFSHHHNNAEKDEILGSIKASAYNDKMHRIELFIWADKEKAKEGLDTLEKTGECSFSMACFRASTPVLTSTGFKPIDTVAVGDTVLTHTGKWKQVTATMSRDVDRYCQVRFVSWGRTVMEATPNHSVLVASFDDLPRVVRKDRIVHPGATWRRRHRAELHTVAKWKSVEDLTEYDYMCVPVMTQSAASSTIDVAWARLCGYYIAEGSISGTPDNQAVEITCNVNDCFVDEVETLADWVSVSKHTHKLTDKALVINCFCKRIADTLAETCGRRCENKRIPQGIRVGSREEKFNFAAAWFNGEGWQDKNGLHWSTHNKNLGTDLQVLLASIGIPTSCVRIDHPEKRGFIESTDPVEYVVSVSNAYSSLFSDISKAQDIPIFGESKLRTFMSGPYMMVPVAGVEHVQAKTKVYNLSVADDETYTAYGLSVHNCKVAFDVCSVCGAKRKNSADQNMCDHIRHQLGKVAETGKVAFMRNTEPQFFDISFVTRPADRIAYSLKVASDEVVTSEMLAKAAEIVAPVYLTQGIEADKRHVIRKLAEQYDDFTRATGNKDTYEPIAKCADAELDDKTIDTLRKMSIKEAMALLQDNGTFMGPVAFCKYAMGPGSAEYAEIGPKAAFIGRLAAQAIKEAAWLDKFDFASASDFDVDSLTARPSRKFTDVKYADFAVKQASFTTQDNILRFCADVSCTVEKSANAHVDEVPKMWLNIVDKPVLAVALKYAEYKVAALNAALHGASQRGESDTNSRELLTALVAAQDL